MELKKMLEIDHENVRIRIACQVLQYLTLPAALWAVPEAPLWSKVLGKNTGMGRPVASPGSSDHRSNLCTYLLPQRVHTKVAAP